MLGAVVRSAEGLAAMVFEPRSPLAPAGMITRLRELSGDDGLLPPWNAVVG